MASKHLLSRRQFLRHTAFGLGALSLAACAVPVAPSSSSGGETAAPAPASAAISFLTQGGNQGAFDRYEPLIVTFQEANAGITVEPIWEPGGAIEVQTKLLTLIAAGDAPDV